jgi:hypothetical protein
VRDVQLHFIYHTQFYNCFLGNNTAIKRVQMVLVQIYLKEVLNNFPRYIFKISCFNFFFVTYNIILLRKGNKDEAMAKKLYEMKYFNLWLQSKGRKKNCRKNFFLRTLLFSKYYHSIFCFNQETKILNGLISYFILNVVLKYYSIETDIITNTISVFYLLGRVK